MAHVRGRDLEWTISEDVYVHNDHIEVLQSNSVGLS